MKEPGRPPVLSFFEDALVEFIIYKYDHGFGMEWQDVQLLARDTAAAMAKALPADHPRKAQLETFQASHR